MQKRVDTLTRAITGECCALAYREKSSLNCRPAPQKENEEKQAQEKEVTRANFKMLLKNLKESAGGEISAIKASNVVVERDFSSSSSH